MSNIWIYYNLFFLAFFDLLSSKVITPGGITSSCSPMQILALWSVSEAQSCERWTEAQPGPPNPAALLTEWGDIIQGNCVISPEKEEQDRPE